jgi:hypothetical protein
MARHTFTIDRQAPTELRGQGMGEGSASLCIFNESSTQGHRSRHNLLNGEFFHRPSNPTPEVKYLGQKYRL